MNIAIVDIDIAQILLDKGTLRQHFYTLEG